MTTKPKPMTKPVKDITALLREASLARAMARKLLRQKNGMQESSIHQPFGASKQTESSWPDALSEAHRGFILAFMELEQAREEAVINSFSHQQE